MPRRRISFIAFVLVSVIALAGAPGPAIGADHDDTDELKGLVAGLPARPDARITDLHAFISPNGENLVISLCTNPAIPAGTKNYVFPSDVKFTLHIDNDSLVEHTNAFDQAHYGGTIVDPKEIDDDISCTVTFQGGKPKFKWKGLRQATAARTFTGLRDDPFIRTPRNGSIIAAMIIEVPLAEVLDEQPDLLIWASAHVDEYDGAIDEHGGRALRSQFKANNDIELNFYRPDHQFTHLGKTPDVIILDTLSAIGFPNGRLLTDDVVDLVGAMEPEHDIRVSEGCGTPYRNCNTVNDKLFLPVFPYLAAP